MLLSIQLGLSKKKLYSNVKDVDFSKPSWISSLKTCRAFQCNCSLSDVKILDVDIERIWYKSKLRHFWKRQKFWLRNNFSPSISSMKETKWIGLTRSNCNRNITPITIFTHHHQHHLSPAIHVLLHHHPHHWHGWSIDYRQPILVSHQMQRYSKTTNRTSRLKRRWRIQLAILLVSKKRWMRIKIQARQNNFHRRATVVWPEE